MELDTIYNMDCMVGLKDIPDNSIDMVLTDIPYGEINRASGGLRNLDKGNADITTFDLNELVELLVRKTKGSIYMFCGAGQLSDIHKVMIRGGMTTRVIIWEKTNPSPMNGDKLWLSGIELCVFGRKKNSTFNEFCKNTVFRHKTIASDIHPTQKPVDLFRQFVLASSNEGDVVLDPFMGSGTTAIACIKENRHFIGFELDGTYYNKAIERINMERAQLTLF